MSEIDKLTGFTAQKFFLERLDDEVLRAKRYKGSISLLMCSPDYEFFEKDPYIRTSLQYAFLRQLGNVFRRILRDVDLMCRYEGEYIIAMLPETGEDGAKLAAERLRKEVEATSFKGDEKKPSFRVALNVGMATFFKHAKTSHELILAAQKGLQVARNEGGNRVGLCPISLEETPSS